MNEKNIKLTSAEIASLWTSYMNDSMYNCILKFMLKHIEDTEIKGVVQQSLDISDKHLKQLQSIFKEDEFAMPIGFDDEDVNMNAPWLYTDIYCLNYVIHMSKVAMISYSGIVPLAGREDVLDYFLGSLTETANHFNSAVKI